MTLPFNIWYRLSPDAAGNFAGLIGSPIEFLMHGDDLRDRMFRVADVEDFPDIQTPALEDYGIAIGNPREARILHTPGRAFTTTPSTTAEAVFDDDHPRAWVDRLVSDGFGVLALTDHGADEFSTMWEWVQTWHVARLSVLYSLDGEGAGLAR